ncbi:MAG: RagB/SusD family nutrient uptake outer membrane protein [Bacteroidales bacterium]
MNRKNTYKLLVLLSTIVFVGGCKEDLDLKPIARDTEVAFYKDSTAIDETLVAAYAQLSAREVFDKDYYLLIGSFPSDDVEAGGENINDYPIAQHYDQLLHSKIDNTPGEEIWGYCYKGCRLANTTLEKMELIKDLLSPSFYKKRKAEAKFLLALYHFILLQTFGGVPIADKVIAPSDFYKPRNTIKEVIDFCVANLQEASANLPVRNDNVGRATKGAALALLGKVLLYESSYAKNYANDERFAGCQQRWQEAFNALKGVIDLGVYKLVGENGERYRSWRAIAPDSTVDGFRWLFTVDGDNSPEGIFEIQSVNDGLGWGNTRGNALTVFTTCRFYLTTDNKQSSSFGWSFNCPTEALINAFRNDDPLTPNLHAAKLNPGDEILDPRFKTTVGRQGDSIYVGPDAGGWRPMILDNTPNNTIGRKFECGWEEYWKDGQWPQGPFNVRLIRYADVLLMAAEAAYMLGDKTTALNYVNRVRTRARMCGNTGYPQNLSEISFEDIIHERRLELATEPFRFFDLVRWGLAEHYLDGVQLKAIPITLDFIPGKHEFSPIPDKEVILSKGALKQYPAWE